jgi:hypothetical protein
MARKPGDKTAAQDREARLKAALKANLARRKAQARARAAGEDTEQPDDTGDRHDGQ